ncbi:MAG TPA: hypothetical protein VGB50_05805 [Flavobacterium sp.]|jgi:hypothetical protein
MKSNFLFAFVVFPVVVASQNLLHGTLVSDTYPATDVFIINQANQKSTLSAANGDFKIAANEGDTIVIGGLSFKVFELIVRREHFETGVEIKLQPEIYKLEEIVIPRYRLSGDLSRDSRHIPKKIDTLEVLRSMIVSAAKIERDFPDDEKSRPRFNVMPVMESQLTGVDLFGVVELLLSGIIKHQPKKKEKTIGYSSFQEAATQRYSAEFFMKTLKLTPHESLMFLDFCAAKNPDLSIFNRGRDLELLEFLLAAHREFVNK